MEEEAARFKEEIEALIYENRQIIRETDAPSAHGVGNGIGLGSTIGRPIGTMEGMRRSKISG